MGSSCVSSYFARIQHNNNNKKKKERERAAEIKGKEKKHRERGPREVHFASEGHVESSLQTVTRRGAQIRKTAPRIIKKKRCFFFGEKKKEYIYTFGCSVLSYIYISYSISIY